MFGSELAYTGQGTLVSTYICVIRINFCPFSKTDWFMIKVKLLIIKLANPHINKHYIFH